MSVARISAIILFLALPSLAQQTSTRTIPQQVTQRSFGNCSPNIQDVSGNVTIQFTGSACAGLDPATIKKLNEFLADFPKTQHRLQELLDKKDQELAAKVKEAEEWAGKYRDLSQRLQAQPPDDELSRKAAALLKDNDLDAAEHILTELVERDHKRANQALNQLARDEFNLAETYALTNRWKESEAAYEEVAQIYRELAKGSPLVYAPSVAETLTALASVYAYTDTLKSQAAFAEAVQIYRDLAKSDPAVYQPKLAPALGKLALTYYTMNQRKEYRSALQEDLQVYRELTKRNPAAYEPMVEMIQEGLAIGAQLDEVLRRRQ